MLTRLMIAAIVLPSALACQTIGFRHRVATCGEAITAIRGAPNEAALKEPLKRAGSCSEATERATAAISALQRLRVSTDTFALSTLTAFAAVGADDAIDGLLAVAADRSASEVVRISAIAALMRQLKPQRSISYKDLTGGIGERGLPRSNCSGGFIAHQMPPSRYSAEVQARIAATGRRLYEDTTEAPNIRSAGACIS